MNFFYRDATTELGIMVAQASNSIIKLHVKSNWWLAQTRRAAQLKWKFPAEMEFSFQPNI
jgi:hypothetical protein